MRLLVTDDYIFIDIQIYRGYTTQCKQILRKEVRTMKKFTYGRKQNISTHSITSQEFTV